MLFIGIPLPLHLWVPTCAAMTVLRGNDGEVEAYNLWMRPISEENIG